jgi:hypothetical protein
MPGFGDDAGDLARGVQKEDPLSFRKAIEVTRGQLRMASRIISCNRSGGIEVGARPFTSPCASAAEAALSKASILRDTNVAPTWCARKAAWCGSGAGEAASIG